MDNRKCFYKQCDRCTKKFHMSELYVCPKCKMILCNDCLNYYRRRTAEINFMYHYTCFNKNKDKEPAEFVKMLNS